MTSPAIIRFDGRSFRDQITSMKDRLVDQDVQQARRVRLDDKEEELLDRDGKGDRAKDGVGRIGPYATMDEIRIPGHRRHDRDLRSTCPVSFQRLQIRPGNRCSTYADEPQGLVNVKAGAQGTMQVRQKDRRRDGVLEMSARLRR